MQLVEATEISVQCPCVT